MYNLSNLNDYEFEILCKDIMEKKLSKNLHRFSKGRDGGIDLCDSKIPMQNMIQVKHYINSKYANLRTALKSEIEKVEKQNPANYYVCCSVGLTNQQKREIASFFPKRMKDISFIIDKVEIDDFLSKEENKEIVEKNYKLWLCSTNVLSTIQNHHVFVDCSEILSDVEKYTKLFVTTKAYYDCRNKLIDKNIIIIIGTPGVGKSTISKMLLLFFASQEYIVRYVTDNNIKDIKNVLSDDPTKKEIILLDDFLGQHYLNLSDKQPNELKTLISFIERNPNKKIIMNSRITIINEASSSSLDFANLIDKYESENYLIDLDKMSDLEKAKILYNHLYFNELPNEYLSCIKDHKNYVSIIKHKNYNPRIIEYVTKPKNYTKVLPSDYMQYIVSKLNNPDSVWEDEFRNRLEEIDRILMNTLYSLTNTKIDKNILKIAFNKRILKTGQNTTLNTFEDVITRLTNSLLKIIIEKGKQYISVINPSVNDYMNKKIDNNANEQITIINNACYIEQIAKFKHNKKEIYELIYNNKIMDLNSIDKTMSYHYLNLIINYELKDLSIKEYIQNAFLKVCSEYLWGYDDLIVNLIEKGFVKYYNLEEIILNNLDNILNNFCYDNLLVLFEWHKSIDDKIANNIEKKYEESFIQAIQDRVMDLVNDDLQEVVNEEISSLTPEVEIPNGITLDERKDIYVDEYYEYVKEKINDIIHQHLNELISKTPVKITIEKIDYDYIFYNLDIDNAIKSYVENEMAELKAEYYMDSEKYSPTADDWNVINQIFN